jgi:thioesterase domain-containing protein
MATYVLVHGAWGGAWVWRRLLGPLRAAGHTAHAVTLTGTGDRAHLLHPGIGLADHVRDVVAVVQAEELGPVILVGHSYGGMVVTGAADALLSAGTEVSQLVYVDAVVPHSGECWSSLHDAETVAARTAAARAHGHSLPPPGPAVFGLDAADTAWLARRHVPHPFGPYREPLHFDAARLALVPRTFVDCHAPAFPTIAPFRARVRAEPGWDVREISTGHFPMVSTPEALARILLELAAVRR